MDRTRTIAQAFKRFTEAVKLQIELEKQLSNLKVLTGDTEEYEKINSLVAWNRNEFVKRPEKFTGDHIPIKIVEDNVAVGCSLDLAIQKTYIILKSRFAAIDKIRMFGK